MKQNGFTLVELMITVVIISILAAIAYPSYQDSVRQTRRAIAQADLVELASHMERIYTSSNSYLSASGALPDMGNDFYDFDFSAGPTQTTYTLEADPTGAQATDSCGTLTISNTGVQGAGATDCW